jgi:hypothetical protein
VAIFFFSFYLYEFHEILSKSQAGINCEFGWPKCSTAGCLDAGKLQSYEAGKSLCVLLRWLYFKA